MSKSTNDKIDEILEKHRHDYWDYCKNLIDSTEFEKREDETKRQIEDFYRNKIPEKKPMGDYITNPRHKGWNDCVDDITAQFNSKGEE